MVCGEVRTAVAMGFMLCITPLFSEEVDIGRPGAVIEQTPQAADLSVRFQHTRQRVSDDALLAYWPFDEGSGYEFSDASGRGQTAFVTGDNWNTSDSGLTVALHRHGRRGKCIYLNGSQWVEARNTVAGDAGRPFTVSAWIRPDRDGASTIVRSGRYAFHLARGYALSLSVGASGVRSAPGVFAPGKWTHVAGVADADGRLRLYVDGAIVDSQAHASAVSAPISGTRMGERFTGWLDEVAIHRQGLGGERLRGLYVTGFPKAYIQTRETIDPGKKIWTAWHGNDPVPHPVESDTVFLANYNGSLASHTGRLPKGAGGASVMFTPGTFGAAYRGSGIALEYASPVRASEGTAELWFLPDPGTLDRQLRRKDVILRLEGARHWLELYSERRCWKAAFGVDPATVLTVESEARERIPEGPLHLAVTWANRAGSLELALFVNGVDVARGRWAGGEADALNRRLLVGNDAGGAIDDLRISSRVRSWGEICPRGHVETESASLDLRTHADRGPADPLFLWRDPRGADGWRYSVRAWEDDGGMLGDSGESRRSIYQNGGPGSHLLYHPDAFGERSSIEAGVAFEESSSGWAGVFVQSPSSTPSRLSGVSFALNPATGSMRLAARAPAMAAITKEATCDFPIVPRRTYTLTLAYTGGDVVHGYVNGHNLLSMKLDSRLPQGYAGLFSEGIAAHFDDVHFTALTPATAESRLIQQRAFSDAAPSRTQAVLAELSLHAFRWKKRYGALPWQRTSKSPMPPGAIFSAADGVRVPNPSQVWRAEDSANSLLLQTGDSVYLIQRGNPRYGPAHGPARLGIHSTPAERFDGIHFTDRNQIVEGHEDPAPEVCRDRPPRDKRLQVNDPGAVVTAGRIVIVVRESRNRVPGYPRFHRLVSASYDLQRSKWEESVVRTVDWSQADPSVCCPVIKGINTTPELFSLRDPADGRDVIFLLYGSGTVAGFHYEQGLLRPAPEYPARSGTADVWTYGQRIMFDNGIYYLNYNVGSSPDKLKSDWPDRFHLASSLDPYAGPWVQSAVNDDAERAYFARGAPFDFDNAAIWHGSMFKYRGHYYMYYETYHSVGDVDRPYADYDDIQAGSRVGYATAN